MDRRSDTRQPIRLRVEFPNVKALVAEYTTSISKGGCTIPAAKALPVGTRFVFELTVTSKTTKTIEIEGVVVHATPRKDGKFDLGITYSESSTPRAIARTRFLDEVLAEQLANRKHARVQVNLVIEDLDAPKQKYLLRDLSRGGFGLKLRTDSPLPEAWKIGTRAELSLFHDGDVPFVLPCQIVRVERKEGGGHRDSLGLAFVELCDANARIVDALLYLHRPQGLFIRFFAKSSR